MDSNGASPADRPVTAAGALGALGIVYGDLGTSPLYTYQTIVGSVGGHPSAEDALGLLSLVVWALIIVVSIKYAVFVMRADNHGEGGILALMALVTKHAGRAAGALIAAGLFGAALIYGDGIITPAISVLSALEGVNVVTDVLKPYVLPAALVVLVTLFWAQMRGTASIGRIFGPVMLVWFVVIAALGLLGVLRRPEVVLAVNPLLAIGFAVAHGWQTFFVLGGVFLALTGGEAMYADMGHLGRKPIRLSWFCVVLPALLLCYAGQTALLLENPGLDGNPFFRLSPARAVVPLVVLATFATIIASQAIITGAFSLTRQAMQLGWFPGLSIRQTSDQEYGQIYVPVVNWTMMACTLILTFAFGSSDALAGAYGTAVSTTMLLTTALLFVAGLAMPVINRFISRKYFPALQKKHGASWWRSAGFALFSLLLFFCAWLVSLPFSLFFNLGLIIQPALIGWFTYRVMAYDALAAHASAEERKIILKQHRWQLWIVGIVTGLLSSLPGMIWLGGVLWIVVLPVFAAFAIWLYVLVFMFSGIWFQLFCLDTLQHLRGASPEPQAAS